MGRAKQWKQKLDNHASRSIARVESLTENLIESKEEQKNKIYDPILFGVRPMISMPNNRLVKRMGIITMEASKTNPAFERMIIIMSSFLNPNSNGI